MVKRRVARYALSSMIAVFTVFWEALYCEPLTRLSDHAPKEAAVSLGIHSAMNAQLAFWKLVSSD